MNNFYDRDEPSEAPISFSKPCEGMCKSCGVYKLFAGPSTASWGGSQICPACYRAKKYQ